jgi:hypothetical protein
MKNKNENLAILAGGVLTLALMFIVGMAIIFLICGA